MSDIAVGLAVILAGLLCLALFFAPTIIAFARHHHFKMIIMAINLILGITGIGYLIALIWAMWPQKTALVDIVSNDLISAPNNQDVYRQRGENAKAYDVARYGDFQNQPPPTNFMKPIAATSSQYSLSSQSSIVGDQQVKNCPYCGEQIAAKAIKCKHCQTMLTGENTTRSAVS